MLLFAEELREHFGKYGEIESITVKMDPQTGRSRGFAFLVFKSAENLDKVLILLFLVCLCCSNCSYFRL